MLWEVEIRPAKNQADREAQRVLQEAGTLHAGSIVEVASARSFLIRTDRGRADVERAANELLLDPLVETMTDCAAIRRFGSGAGRERDRTGQQ